GGTHYMIQRINFPAPGQVREYPVLLPTPAAGAVNFDIAGLTHDDRSGWSPAQHDAFRATVKVAINMPPTNTITIPDPAAPAPGPAPAPAAPPVADGVKKDTTIRLFDFLRSLAPVPLTDDGRPLF
ncbi:hypothetical protein ACR6JC_23865, partial [Citrobacter europaeus]|uniref:hypothetical protein n=1 Tax=Citrobacter europaeus TaxID=1914243 RepID=UPI003EDAE3BD